MLLLLLNNAWTILDVYACTFASATSIRVAPPSTRATANHSITLQVDHALDREGRSVPPPMDLFISVIVALAMALGGYLKHSLDRSGAVAAALVGTVTFWASTQAGVVLITFFITSSIVTRVGSTTKRVVEHGYKEGGGRSWVQVLANSPATLLCVAMLFVDRAHHHVLLFGYLAQLSAMQGDTWSSEIGVLSSAPPLLCTTLRAVPKGTNGAVSALGTGAALLGGGALSLPLLLLPGGSWSTLKACVFYACVGTCLDSFLGATLQYSGLDKAANKVVERPGPGVTHICGRPLLDNHLVNLITSLVMMGFGLATANWFH